MKELAEWTKRLADGSCTAVELVADAFASGAGDLAILIAADHDAAHADAAEADRLRANGDKRPFLGVPITIKDNFDVTGQATTAGSLRLSRSAPAVSDAAAVARLKAAGFVVLGKTNMTELAFSGLGLNPHFGTPENPRFPNERRIPGGSSSGAAVSVALHLVPAALGTDTGGSVRIPAAFCGLVGFKPTARFVSRSGVVPLSTSLDAVGVIAGSVADCRIVFGLIRDEPTDQKTIKRGPADIRLGVVTNYVREGEQAEVGSAFEAALSRLDTAGVSITRIEVAALDDIRKIAPRASFSAVEAAGRHASYLEADGDARDPRVLSRVLPGLDVDRDEYLAMTWRRSAFSDAFNEVADKFDALVWPTVPIVAPRFDDLQNDADYYATNLLVLRNSSIANLADGCAISLPCQLSDAPPVGMTLAAAGGSDDALLDVAAAIERILKSREISGGKY